MHPALLQLAPASPVEVKRAKYQYALQQRRRNEAFSQRCDIEYKINVGSVTAAADNAEGLPSRLVRRHVEQPGGPAHRAWHVDLIVCMQPVARTLLIHDYDRYSLPPRSLFVFGVAGCLRH